MRPLVVGTRGSALALWQARRVAARLQDLHADLRIEERIVHSEGDLDKTRPVGIDDRGIYVRSLERALLAAEIDLAVHSLKDLPTDQPAGLTLAAIPERHDPSDVLVTRAGSRFEELPAGTVIGTGSYRRRAQLLNRRPDLATRGVRGNVDTRVGKLAAGEFGALVLARAGLERLRIDRLPFLSLDFDLCLPAAGQGALAVEIRTGDGRTAALVGVLEDLSVRAEVTAERAFLRELGGGCLAPATAFARVVRVGELHVRAAVGDADGEVLLRGERRGPFAAAEELGVELAHDLNARGAGELLASARVAAARDGRA